jgi:hypothetical protein
MSAQPPNDDVTAVDPEALLVLIGKLKVEDRELQTPKPWVLWDEQREIVEAWCRSDRILLLKGRRIGASTLCALLLLVDCLMTPGIRGCIVAPDEPLAQFHLARLRSFAEQLGVLRRGKRLIVTLTNGSQIEALSAQGSFRGRGYRSIWATEMDFWKRRTTWGQLIQTAPKGAKIVGESTATGPEGLMNHLWKADSDDEKLFFSVEDHAAYRVDRPLSADETAKAKDLGYTDPQAAAWFFDKLENDFQGDLTTALREYPQLPGHSFYWKEGRYIDVTPRVLPSTTRAGFDVFTPPVARHRYIASCDPALGTGSCDASIVVLDRTTLHIVATFSSNTTAVDELVEMMASMTSFYGVDEVVIETNGMGKAVYRLAVEHGLPAVAHSTTGDTQLEGLLLVKRAVEKGELAAGKDFADECESLELRYSGRRKFFVGRKDLLMAVANIYPRIVSEAYAIPKPDEPGRMKLERFLRPKVWY